MDMLRKETVLMETRVPIADNAQVFSACFILNV